MLIDNSSLLTISIFFPALFIPRRSTLLTCRPLNSFPQARSVVALESLRSTFEEHLDGGGFELSGTPPVLAIPLVPSSVPSERLRIAVSARTG